MPPQIAAVAFVLGILGLFWLDRDPRTRASWLLWLPVIWLSLAGSRSVSQWPELEGGSTISLEQALMEGNPVDRFVYTVLVVAGLVVLATRAKRVWGLLRANGPILMFFAYCLASLLWSDYPDVAFKRWTKALGDFVMVLIVLSDREPLAALKRLLSRTTYLLIPLSVLLVKYYPKIGKEYGVWDGRAFYSGVTTNKNTLGAICLFLGIGSLWRFLAAFQGNERVGRSRRLLVHGIILSMVLWLFWKADSMTALFCLLLASALLLTTSLRPVVRRPAVVHLLVLVVILVPFSTLFLGVGASFAHGVTGRDVSTLTDRTELWKLVLSLDRNPICGTGFESFWLGPRLEKIYSIYPWHPNQAHNGYLEIFLNLGWIGVACLAFVIATGYSTVYMTFRRHQPEGRLILVFFVAGVIYNFTEAAYFRMTAPAWIFFLLAITRAPGVPRVRLKYQPRSSLNRATAPTLQPSAPLVSG